MHCSRYALGLGETVGTTVGPLVVAIAVGTNVPPNTVGVTVVGTTVGSLVGFDVGLILIVGANVVSAVHHDKGSEVATHPLAFKYASPCGLEVMN